MNQIPLPIASRSMQLEQLALYAFAAVLPLFEAPKNLLWLAFAGLWFYNRLRARDLGGPWDAWDTLIVVWLASGYAAAAFAGIHHAEWSAASDIVRYASVLWLLKRSRYAPETLARLAACLVAGTAAGLAWGAYGVIAGQHVFLGLSSVGHVNHSAIYLAIVFGLALVWLRASWRSISSGVRASWLALCALFALSLLVMQSRAALAAAFVAALALLAVYALRARHSFRKVMFGAIVIAAAVLLAKPAVVEKNEAALQNDYFLQARDGVWRAGIEAWREFPLFGVGMGNWERISYERLEDWRRARGQPFDRDSVFLTSHGHSLYVNTLVERGAVGLAALLGVLLAWAASLVRSLPGAASPPIAWAYWGGASFAWMIAVIVGLVNTTLHHEQALASMLLFGGWLSLRRSLPPEPGGR